LINALQKHVLGKKKMESTQVSAALGLLKKCLPDMASIEGARDDRELVVRIVR